MSSDVRIKIINMLALNPFNIKQLSKELGLSSAIVTPHVRKLETAAIIYSERKSVNRSVQKICYLRMNTLEVQLPSKQAKEKSFHEFAMSIGHFSDFSVTPTCGIATSEKLTGRFDDPRYFPDPDRVNAGILWFTEGYVEYKVPNFLLSVQEPEELEIPMELGSEASGINSNCPSDITFFLNEQKIGQRDQSRRFWKQQG